MCTGPSCLLRLVRSVLELWERSVAIYLTLSVLRCFLFHGCVLTVQLDCKFLKSRNPHIHQSLYPLWGAKCHLYNIYLVNTCCLIEKHTLSCCGSYAEHLGRSIAFQPRSPGDVVFDCHSGKKFQTQWLTICLDFVTCVYECVFWVYTHLDGYDLTLAYMNESVYDSVTNLSDIRILIIFSLYFENNLCLLYFWKNM